MKNTPSYINIHTHANTADDAGIAIYNQFLDDKPESLSTFISIGIHPWKINSITITQDLIKLEHLLKNKNVLALGECGLDRLIDIPLTEQEKIFIAQIHIAKAFNKPLIIHCVRAFDDVIRIKKEQKISSPMIIHGYNNNQQIANQLIKSGFHFSFGKALLIKQSNASKAINSIPLDNLFLETDDAAISIKEIYAAAAQHLKMDLDELKQLIHSNFKRVFLNS